MAKIIQALLVILGYSKGVRNVKRTIAASIITGCVAGVAGTGLIGLFNVVLSGTQVVGASLILLFVILCIFIPTVGYISEILLARLTAQAEYDLRLQMAGKILAAPYALLEQIGAHKLLAVITEDTRTVTEAVAFLPVVVTQMAIMVGCLVYLGWLCWWLLLIMVLYMVVGTLGYKLLLQRALRYMALVRENWDQAFKGIRGIIEGTKELKQHRGRRADFFTRQLDEPVESIRRNQLAFNNYAVVARKGGQILFSVFIGIVLFVIPRFFRVDHGILSGYTLTVLFMMSPFSIILGNLPAFGRAQVAADKIKSLGLTLENSREERMSLDSSVSTPNPVKSWSRLDLVDINHVYRGDDNATDFSLGPLRVTFYPGELVFLVGGNGSGKTTLAKLLIGLYEPQQGQIYLDNTPVTSDNRDDYRQNFSVVFYDFYLFDYLFGLADTNGHAEMRHYLVQLQLQHKVTVADGKFSTLELSQGQRKRLALLTAYLEDRPIYVFDEWASDQDPVFKKVFYDHLLPELKAKGKTVIVITHDDRYFHVADRVIKLERGQIEFDHRYAEAANTQNLSAPSV